MKFNSAQRAMNEIRFEKLFYLAARIWDLTTSIYLDGALAYFAHDFSGEVLTTTPAPSRC